MKKLRVIHKINTMWISSVDNAIIIVIIELNLRIKYKKEDIPVDNFLNFQKNELIYEEKLVKKYNFER